MIVNQEDKDPGDDHSYGKYELTVRKALILGLGLLKRLRQEGGSNSVPFWTI